jgi:hypothetical protein
MTALALRPRSLPRRLAAAAVAMAYALPLVAGAVSNVSHGAFHVIERLQEHRAQAAALGLAHLGARTSFTHTHDGVTHSHSGAVDALLVAAEQTDEQTEAAPPMLKLSLHTPASVVDVVIALGVARVTSSLDRIAPSHPRALPPVPPPRA